MQPHAAVRQHLHRRGRARRYRSFSQAAEENALSRILVGFHFRNAVEKGIKHGRKIGSYAVSRYLRPVR